MPLPAFPESLPEFQRTFPDEESCVAYLEDVRWPDGFSCPYCGKDGDPYRIETRPTVLECPACRRQISLTSGTVMERTHTPLCTWFWAAYLVSSQTPGMSAVQFQRQLGFSRYETAFQMLHKLRAGMVRPDRDRIGAEWPVEADETFVGGRTRGEGKGVHHKAIVAIAVEIRKGGKQPEWEHTYAKPKKGKVYAGRLRMHVVPDRSKKSLEASLPMVHIIASNLKAWLLGIHHGVSQQHLQAYLNEFTFRFNRRFYPFVAFNSLLGIGVDVDAPTYEQLYSGEWVHPNPGNGTMVASEIRRTGRGLR